MNVTWRLVSPPQAIGRGGAIAIIELRGDVSELLVRMLGADVPVGRTRLVEPPGVDQMIVARMAADDALLFPHAGTALTKRVIAAIEAAGAQGNTAESFDLDVDPRDAAALANLQHEALCRAASPLAIDLLLEQPERWARVWATHDQCDAAELVMPPEGSAALRRLIDPPLVVALGPPNVGKSSLLNTLCGRSVSVVADEPGTTRDHVGALINLAGLTVRFIDAPGIDPRITSGGVSDALQQASQSLALTAARGADLLLWCGDAASGFLTDRGEFANIDRVRVGLRSDLGAAAEPVDAAVSTRQAAGLNELVAVIRERLVPNRWLQDHRAWRFWDRDPRSQPVP